MSNAFSTEERLRQMERRKKRKEAGLDKFATKREKVVEQHFDDCGEDLSSIVDVTKLYCQSMLMDYFSETETEPDLDNSDVHISLQASLLGSDAASEQWAQRQKTYEASDLAEFIFLPAEKRPHWGIDALELCGGEARVTYLSVKRHLTTGQCFDIKVACDLNLAAHQQAVRHHLGVAKPLAVVMAPMCRPFGPRAALNRSINPDAWLESYQHAAPHGRFCGHVAKR